MRTVKERVDHALSESSRCWLWPERSGYAREVIGHWGLASSSWTVADPALGEAGLAVGEVQRPEPPEALVVAELRRASSACAAKLLRQRRSVST